ncbi:hypothetical protein [Paenibacillus sp. R14(2021)]|uniref:hypothetical protein n=1 Tax=Paenibacillus sp. R14(2021) TaxID=2859228 RepID=UPI001C61669A|nr:hypothetical protein [Paenibacillus sp. R14(2021)]
MVAQSDLKICEISTLVGIANPRYFSLLFNDKYRIIGKRRNGIQYSIPSSRTHPT